MHEWANQSWLLPGPTGVTRVFPEEEPEPEVLAQLTASGPPTGVGRKCYTSRVVSASESESDFRRNRITCLQGWQVAREETQSRDSDI